MDSKVRCDRCGYAVPEWLWINDDHPIIVESQPAKIFRTDNIEDNTMTIVAETKVGVRMCKDVNLEKLEEKILNLTVATPIEDAVFQALGAASVCWEKMDNTGIFDSDRCKKIGEELIEYFNSKGPIY